MLVDMRPAVESSENITIMDEIDELLGTRRSYGWNSGSRPSMISAKYRLKEERRKVLKISVNKMKKIDDAESSLCRSVLINNTVKRLQAETRDDRATGRTSPASPPSPASAGYGYLHGPLQQSLHQPCGGGGGGNGGGGNPQLVDITNLRESTGAVNGVVVVGKTTTLLQTNNNNNSSSINNNNKPSTQLQTDALQSSSLAADQLLSHHHHPHQHHPHQNHLHHNHHHQHHHHHHHQHLLHSQQQQQQYEYDDCGVEDECGGEGDDDDRRRCNGCSEADDAEQDDIASIMMHSSGSSCGGGGVKRKRSAAVASAAHDEPLDDLLSQFINCTGGGQREDEDVNVVDLDLHEYPAAKRLRTDEAAAAAAITASAASGSAPAETVPASASSSSSSAAASASAVTPSTADLGCPTDCWTLMDACCDDSLDLYGGQVPAAVEHQDVQLLPASADCCGPLHQQPPSHGELQQLSCGQASMFSEMQMQSAMFRNLIASLES